jgi:membrane protein implicated in regulation of membrane protease activity
MAFLTELTWLHWLILGGALLILELLGGAGYLLWLGLAALSVASVVALLPLGWAGQWLLFSLLALLFTGGWWYWQRQRLQGKHHDPASQLNQRPQQWLGQEAILQQDVVNGLSRVRLGDSVWPVRCKQHLVAGAAVRVTAVDGITLIVEALEPQV